ncbi:MAG: phycobilisome protein [Cyanobacteria bacterium SBLK]|nr:phycobilisome protein [Cyanobacteria bacterium SBLK]
MQLSERAKQLIPKARIVSFATWQEMHPSEAISLFQQADDERYYLTDADLAALQGLSFSDEGLKLARLLRDRASDIVTEAREEVLAHFPQIIQPGGELYPPFRAEACWRDFWHFLRCVTYGIAGGNSFFTSEEGLKNMNLLYQELKVPLPAMILGLESLKVASLKYSIPQQTAIASACFDHLIEKLKTFQP